jgi:hypothetical protein
MNKPRAIFGVVAVGIFCGATAYAGPSSIAVGAPAELAHWEKLIGDWSTAEEGLRPDGSAWDPSKGADWNFYWSFDGWGIRDDYTSPPMSESVDDESTRQRGTNLRIYNPTTEQWVMTWLTPASATPANFTATSTDETIVMLSDVANPQGFFGRITFFDMAESSFDWKLEWSKDKEQWLEVYRIHGTRKP